MKRVSSYQRWMHQNYTHTSSPSVFISSGCGEHAVVSARYTFREVKQDGCEVWGSWSVFKGWCRPTQTEATRLCNQGNQGGTMVLSWKREEHLLRVMNEAMEACQVKKIWMILCYGAFGGFVTLKGWNMNGDVSSRPWFLSKTKIFTYDSIIYHSFSSHWWNMVEEAS